MFIDGIMTTLKLTIINTKKLQIHTAFYFSNDFLIFQNQYRCVM